MRPLLILILVLQLYDLGWANEEITVELPGGATMKMVWIEPGTFVMGSPEDEEGRHSDEGPQHEVTISKGFWLGKYELTQGQWESVMGTTPWSGQVYVRSNPAHPAVHISWYDMQEFIQRLNTGAGVAIYRLPTEAEWEYACRAGTTSRCSFGNDVSQLMHFAWYSENTCLVEECYAHAVGSKLPNPWGLYDMHGNVWEWCQDWYGSYPSGRGDLSSRVIRGGVFVNGAKSVRSAIRYGDWPVNRGSGLGARLLRMDLKATLVPSTNWGQIKKDSQ